MSYVLTVPYTDLNPLPPNNGIFYSPRLLTLLEFGNARSKFWFHSVVDSGADFSVFPASFGEALGMNIKSGAPYPMGGFGGGGVCYYHNVKVILDVNNQGWHYDCFAGFSEQMNAMGIGLLGRQGFFELFEEVTFNQRKKVFHLKVPTPIPPGQPPVPH